MPTLIEKNPDTIRIQSWMTEDEKKRAKSTRAVDYVVEFLNARRTPTHRRPEWGRRAVSTPGGKVVLLESATGSGKSTVLPPEVYKDDTSGLSAVTQPRVLTAISIPQEVVIYNKELEIGKNIGWRTRPYKKRLSGRSGIIYMTIGSLAAQASRAGLHTLLMYSTIFIDEVHERDLSADDVQGQLKTFLEQYHDDPRCPLIVLMSATFNSAELKEFYGIPDQNFLSVSGRTFPIEKRYAKTTPSDYVKHTSAVVEKIHTEEKTGAAEDILVFVSGGQAMNAIFAEVEALNVKIHAGGETDSTSYLLPIKLNSRNYKMGGGDYAKLTTDSRNLKTQVKIDGQMISKPCGRKVIISTNVAETGVTLPSLRHVIDTGKVISVTYDPFTDSHVLMERPVTRAESKQRMGRVGRIQPGVAHLCYTEQTFDTMRENPLPSILTSDITMLILSTIAVNTEIESVLENHADGYKLASGAIADRVSIPYDVGGSKHVIVGSAFEPNSLNYITWPSIDAFGAALRKLQKLGFIDASLHITPMGFLALGFSRSDPEAIRAIMGGYAWDAQISDVVTVIAMSGTISLNITEKNHNHIYGAIGVLIAAYDEYKKVCETALDADNPAETVNNWARRFRTSDLDWANVVTRRIELLNELDSMGFKTKDVIETKDRPYHDRMKRLRKAFRDGYANRQAVVISDGIWKLNGVTISSGWKLRGEPVCMTLITQNTGGNVSTTVEYAA
ncbi:MAG: hypothetical protein CMK92_04395 [Pseudomonas sp.]|nr:hypothetical protein [Pseudomonas sp.]